MNKEIKKIFLVLGLYAFAGGIFYNFQELWMLNNNLSVKTIGIVSSLCALITVSVIFLCSNLINQNKLKKFTIILLIIKSTTLLSLFILNHTGLNILIKFLIMIDFAIDTEIYACIYPMITFIDKNDKVYAARGLVYDFLYYIGILITSIFIGKFLFSIEFNYNLLIFIASISIIIALFILISVDLNKYIKSNNSNNNGILFELLNNIKKDKITHNYLSYVFMGQISFYTINGLLMLLLTNNLGLSPSFASNLKLIIGVLSVLLGALILSKLTLKNDYINISIKFVTRLITYLLVIIFNSQLFLLIAIICVRITSNSYSHITDAPYVNRFDDKYQLAFCNLKTMIEYFSRAIGTYICGITILINNRLVFAISSIFIVLQIIFAFKALHLRKLEVMESKI